MRAIAHIDNSHFPEECPRAPTTSHRSAKEAARQNRSQATVQAILQATARVLCTTGYDRASTNRIAMAAGVSVGSLYQYFPSKEALVAALVEQHVGEMTTLVKAKLAEVAGAPLPVAIRTMVEAMFAAHAVDPKLHKVLIEQVPRVGRLEQVGGVEREVMELVQVLLEARGRELRRTKFDAVAFVLCQTVEAVTHAAVLAELEPRHAPCSGRRADGYGDAVPARGVVSSARARKRNVDSGVPSVRVACRKVRPGVHSGLGGGARGVVWRAKGSHCTCKGVVWRAKGSRCTCKGSVVWRAKGSHCTCKGVLWRAKRSRCTADGTTRAPKRACGVPKRASCMPRSSLGASDCAVCPPASGTGAWKPPSTYRQGIPVLRACAGRPSTRSAAGPVALLWTTCWSGCVSIGSPPCEPRSLFRRREVARPPATASGAPFRGSTAGGW